MSKLLPSQSSLYFSKISWLSLRVWDGLGNLWMFALAALSLWLGLQWQVIAPLHVQQERYAAEAALHSSALVSASESVGSSGKTLQKEESLEDSLPVQEQREQQIARIMQLAEKKGLQLGRTDYRFEPVEGLAIGRQRVKLKAVGSYSAQRLFLNALLSSMPNIAIDRLVVEQRPEQTSADMVASFELSIFYKAEPAVIRQ